MTRPARYFSLREAAAQLGLSATRCGRLARGRLRRGRKGAGRGPARTGQARASDNAQALLDLLGDDPFRTPPRFAKLVGDLAGAYARRINIQHRLVYQVLKDDHTVKVLRMWSHYE
jgi:Txe/YoeB family toxin of toxin-antitoxin system